MKAYHIRTTETDSPVVSTSSFFNLDSLFIEERRLLMGYAPIAKRKGFVLSYPFNKENIAKCSAIINDDKKYCEKEKITGKLISSPDLDLDLVSRISNFYNPVLKKGEVHYHVNDKRRLNWDYGGSTEELLLILSGIRNIDIVEGRSKITLSAMMEAILNYNRYPNPFPSPAHAMSPVIKW